jgi:hypothetical protein
VLDEPNFPLEWPYQPENFQRFDESSDAIFYDSPRFVTHIDDGAIKALEEFYKKNFPASGNKDVAILDMCSSWISHFPKDYKAGRISGLGMNGSELARNAALTDYVVKDLNMDPVLPYEDNTFDIITNAVSVDYLNKPREVHRGSSPQATIIAFFTGRILNFHDALYPSRLHTAKLSPSSPLPGSFSDPSTSYLTIHLSFIGCEVLGPGKSSPQT